MVLWLRLPEVPVIVRVNVPTLADLEALTVSVLLVVAGLGRNEAVTPLGEPDTDSVTLLLKLLSRLMVMVLVPLPPRATVRELGESERLKSGCGPGVIVSDTVVLCERFPDVPVMVIVNVPTVAVDEADKRSVLEVVVGFGLKEAVTPVGIPDAVKLTLPEKLFTGLTVMMDCPEVPWLKERLEGAAASVKSGGGAEVATVRETEVV